MTAATGDAATGDEAPESGVPGDGGGGTAGAVGAVERIGAIDALRGLMALAVVLYHLHVWTHGLGGAARNAVVVLGTYSVDGFFMVSGLCFFHRYALSSLRGRKLWRFHVKRFFRIAPLYYVAMALTLAFDPSYQVSFSWGRLLENLSLSFGLFHPNHAFVLGGWSIGLEYVFYLALPALLWLTRRRLVLYALTAIFLAWTLRYALVELKEAPEALRFHSYVALPNHAFAFLAGAIAADLRARTDLRLGLAAAFGLLFALCCAAGLSQPPIVDHFEIVLGLSRLKYAALGFAVVLLFAFVTPPRSGLGRALDALGSASYALYLMHPIAWRALSGLVPQLAPGGAQFAWGLLASLVLAAISHHLIERPAIRYGRRLLARRGAGRSARAPECYAGRSL